MGLLDKAKALKDIEKKKESIAKNTPTVKAVIEEKKIKIEPEEDTSKKSYVAGKVIETDFDVLYNLVLTKNKLKISEVAAIFKIDKKKAEEWVQILDEHNLVKIYYPAMGEPEIRKIVEHEKAKE